MKYINAILTIAFRDLIKFLRDRSRLVATLIFPLVFVGVLGSSLESNLGDTVPYDFITFTFIGVFTQVLFQSTASGVISLIEDKENDFAQELFIAPIPRYIIIVGKIVGESLVSISQAVVITLFGLILGISFSWFQLLILIPIAIVAALYGGAFGVLIMGNLEDQRTANQIFPFVLFPQIFLAGVFTPIADLPPVLLFLSRIMPLTYVVDFARNLYYFSLDEKAFVTINNIWLDAGVVAALFVIFIGIGTAVFIRNSRRR